MIFKTQQKIIIIIIKKGEEEEEYSKQKKKKSFPFIIVASQLAMSLVPYSDRKFKKCNFRYAVYIVRLDLETFFSIISIIF